MKAINFELFMCCLGNGITICNKAVIEGGDYKYIAHISAGGNIKFYVSENYIPKDELVKIKKVADENKIEFQRKFLRLSEIEQYKKIIDTVSAEKFIQIIRDKRTLEEKLPEIRNYYFSIA